MLAPSSRPAPPVLVDLGLLSLSALLFALAFGVILPTAFAAGSALTLSLAPVFSYLVHPYLHMRRSEAMRRAPLPVRLFLRTGYAQAMYRNHYLHHRYGGTSNFNLVLGFDALRGRMRRPSQADMDEMNRLGLCRIG